MTNYKYVKSGLTVNGIMDYIIIKPEIVFRATYRDAKSLASLVDGFPDDLVSAMELIRTVVTNACVGCIAGIYGNNLITNKQVKQLGWIVNKQGSSRDWMTSLVDIYIILNSCFTFAHISEFDTDKRKQVVKELSRIAAKGRAGRRIKKFLKKCDLETFNSFNSKVLSDALSDLIKRSNAEDCDLRYAPAYQSLVDDMLGSKSRFAADALCILGIPSLVHSVYCEDVEPRVHRVCQLIDLGAPQILVAHELRLLCDTEVKVKLSQSEEMLNEEKLSVLKIYEEASKFKDGASLDSTFDVKSVLDILTKIDADDEVTKIVKRVCT